MAESFLFENQVENQVENQARLARREILQPLEQALKYHYALLDSLIVACKQTLPFFCKRVESPGRATAFGVPARNNVCLFFKTSQAAIHSARLYASLGIERFQFTGEFVAVSFAFLGDNK